MSDNKPVINTNAPAPPGIEGEGFFAGKLSDIIGMARKFSLWPLPFATSYLSRFGAERMSFSPRQADILLVCGTISKKLAPVLKQVYTQMAEPRWVVAVGACASSGGIFDTYSVLQGIDKIIPVDVYVPGCPPRPEQILEGYMQVQALAENESLRRRDLPEYKALLESYGIK